MHHRPRQSLFVLLRPSRIGAAVALVLHALAVLAALDAPDPWLSAALLVGVLASALATMRRWRHCARADAARVIERDAAGRWWLETCAGARTEVVLAATPLVSQLLIAVSLSAGARRWHLTLFPDSASPHALRRLRAVLRTAP